MKEAVCTGKDRCPSPTFYWKESLKFVRRHSDFWGDSKPTLVENFPNGVVLGSDGRFTVVDTKKQITWNITYPICKLGNYNLYTHFNSKKGEGR